MAVPKLFGRFAGSCLALLAFATALPAQDLTAARVALRTGAYDDALSAFERLASGANASVDAMRLLIRTYSELGRYDDAERAAARFSANPQHALQVSNVLGEVFHARGKFSEAEAAFNTAVTRQSSDSVRALLNLAVLNFDRGARDTAMRQFDHFIDIYNRGGNLSSDDFTAVAIACRYLGLDTPVLFQDALKAFDRAIAADSLNMEPRIRVAELFLEKYQNSEAQGEFDAILRINPRHPRALLGSAQRRLADGHPGADSLVAAALAVNPNLLDAHLTLAEMKSGIEDYAGALSDAAKALQIDASAPAAHTVIAAVNYLKGDSAAYIAARNKALQRNPRYADVFVTLAQMAARNRLYRQAASLALQGTALEPKSWAAHAELGLNQLRLGAVDSARQSLETAFAGDPYNVHIKNTLDLLDTFKDYDVLDNGKFRLMIAKTESALLSIYALDLLERAYEALAARYSYRPPLPIRVEFYRRHADFSVRTVGLTGIGALGVSFGTVLAMDSPTGRETGPFSWGSVLWHELGHTFTLGVTDNKVPRWFSEGLSVYEERRSGVPGWGADATSEFLKAFKANMLVSVGAMNDGFMRPRYAEQVIHSYYQASLLCEMIVAQHGERAIPAMLAAYKGGQSTEQVFRSVLNSSAERLDTLLREFIQTRFRTAIASVGEAGIIAPGPDGEMRVTQEPDSGEFTRAMAAAVEARRAGDNDFAIRLLDRAIGMFPEYAESNSPYVIKAEILAERNDFKGAADALSRHNGINENAYPQLIAEARYREQAGDTAGAVKVLDRSMFVYPYDIKAHEKLAELASRVNERRLAVRERRAVVALKPVDMAEAYYQLALALHESGDNVTARREVLRALEEAPNFAKAQDLLIRIRGGGTP